MKSNNKSGLLLALVFSVMLFTSIYFSYSLSIIMTEKLPVNQFNNNTNNPINKQATYIINTTSDLAALNDTWGFADEISFNITEDIIATVQNFTTGVNFAVSESLTHTIDIDFIDCNFTALVQVNGTPSLSYYNSKFDGNFIVYSSGADIFIKNSIINGWFQNQKFEDEEGSIGSIDLEIENSVINHYFRFRVLSSSTVKITDTNSSSSYELSLVGFDQAVLKGGNLGSNIKIAKDLEPTQDINIISCDDIELNSINVSSIEIKGYLANQNITIKNNSIVQDWIDADADYSSVILDIFSSQINNLTLRGEITTNLDGSSINNMFVRSTSTTSIEGSTISGILMDYVNPTVSTLKMKDSRSLVNNWLI